MESSHSSSLFFISLCISAAFFFSGAAAEMNVTGIIDKAGQFSVLVRLLGATQVGSQLTNEINNSYQGITFFAPNDGAFNSLPTGFLNGLTREQQVKLVMFHVLSKAYTWDDFRTISNPVDTQASGPNGPYGLNFTYISNQQVNVSSGAVNTTFSNAINVTKSLAVYEVSKVLVPADKFNSSPAPSPSPSDKNATSAAEKPSTKGTSSPASPTSSSGSAATSVYGQWSFMRGLLAFISFACIGLMM